MAETDAQNLPLEIPSVSYPYDQNLGSDYSPHLSPRSTGYRLHNCRGCLLGRERSQISQSAT
eukprot:935294-Amorphochlora_amoeboformis.AAC.1